MAATESQQQQSFSGAANNNSIHYQHLFHPDSKVLGQQIWLGTEESLPSPTHSNPLGLPSPTLCLHHPWGSLWGRLKTRAETFPRHTPQAETFPTAQPAPACVQLRPRRAQLPSSHPQQGSDLSRSSRALPDTPTSPIKHLLLPELQLLTHQVQGSLLSSCSEGHTRVTTATFRRSLPSNLIQVVSGSKTKILGFFHRGDRAKHTGKRQDLGTSFPTGNKSFAIPHRKQDRSIPSSHYKRQTMPSLIFKNCFPLQSPLSLSR